MEAFRTGKRLGQGDYHHYLFEGTERFFKPTYVARKRSGQQYRKRYHEGSD